MHVKEEAAPAAASPPPGCPVHAGGGGGEARSVPKSKADTGTVYNVYSVPIDPSNKMPAAPQQSPAPGQEKPLSTQRVRSSIPKGGTADENWLYPSPQMFYNALARKGKLAGATEDDMDVVVSIHNAMNEKTWKQLLGWEVDLHGSSLAPGCPKLRRFQGRPWELSLKAKVKSWLGYGFPFDRHDWYIDRGDGVERRYIIDYYFNAEANEKAENVHAAVGAIHVDVRPALDSVEAAVDRLRAFPARAVEALGRKKFRAEGLDPSTLPKEVRLATEISRGPAPGAHGGGGEVREVGKEDVREGVQLVASIHRKCGAVKAELAAAADDATRSTKFIQFHSCVGSLVCPEETRLFAKAFETGKDETYAPAFDALVACNANVLRGNAKFLQSAEEHIRDSQQPQQQDRA
jgi:cytochrome c heme-lyase